MWLWKDLSPQIQRLELWGNIYCLTLHWPQRSHSGTSIIISPFFFFKLSSSEKQKYYPKRTHQSFILLLPFTSVHPCHRPLHMFHDLAANDWPADPCAQHVRDQPAGEGRPGGQYLLWGTGQHHSAHRARSVLRPDWAAALKPATISWAHSLRPGCCPVRHKGKK